MVRRPKVQGETLIEILLIKGSKGIALFLFIILFAELLTVIAIYVFQCLNVLFHCISDELLQCVPMKLLLYMRDVLLYLLSVIRHIIKRGR